MDERQQHRPGDGGAGDVEPLKLGRAASARRAWDDAYRRLSRADAAASLAVEDLERLAMSDGTG